MQLNDKEKIKICNKVLNDNTYIIRIKEDYRESEYINTIINRFLYLKPGWQNKFTNEKIKLERKIRLEKIKLLKNDK